MLEDSEMVDEPIDQELVWYNEYKDQSYKKLAARMVELREESSAAEKKKTALDKELDIIRLRIVPERFLKDELTSMNIDGVGRLGLTSDAYCNQIAACKEELFEWLRNNEYGDLIKDTVNPSSLKSLVKTLEKDQTADEVVFDPSAAVDESEETLFEQVCKFVNYTPFMRAAVTKK